MNDELSGQLTSSWQIPPYAQEALWVQGEGFPVKAEGAHGLFHLEEPANQIVVRWGGIDGPPIVALPWQPDCLEWNGRVAIGGTIDALHILPTPQYGTALLYVSGRPLEADYHPYPRVDERLSAPYRTANFSDSLASLVDVGITTWLIPAEKNHLLGYLRDALLRELRVQIYGHLADAASGLGEEFALPLIIDALTVFPDD